MKTSIRGSIRQFIARYIIADGRPPQRSELDEQDMPGQMRGVEASVSGPTVPPLPTLPGRHSALPHLQSSGRLKGRRAARVHRADDSASANKKI